MLNLKRLHHLDEQEKSRGYFILEGTTGVGQFVLTSGAFLAGFSNMIGVSDSLNGIIAVIPALTGVFQLLSPIIFEGMQRRKKTIIAIVAIFRLLLSTVYFIPLLLMKSGYSVPIFILLFALSYAMAAIMAPALTDWLVMLTPLQIRGRYFALKDKVALLISAFMTIGIGKVLDHFDQVGHKGTGFIVIGVLTFLLGLLNIYSLVKAKEPAPGAKTSTYGLKSIIKVPLASKSFRMVILLFIVWNIGLQIGGPYIPVYMVTKLNFSYTYITTLTILLTLVRVLCSSFWGKVGDRKSWFLSTKCSILVLALTHFTWSFVNIENYRFLAVLLHLTAGFAWAGVNISLFNLQFLFAKKEGRTMYIGLNAAIGGISGFLSASLGGLIVKLTGSMQIVFMLSGIILLLCPIMVMVLFEKGQLVMEEQ